MITIHNWKSALQASVLWRETSSSRSTNPVQFEGERSLPSDDPEGTYLQNHALNLTVFVYTHQFIDPFVFYLILENVKTFCSGGLQCSPAGTVCPCGLIVTWGCEVAPGLPQGGVDISDGARTLHFT